MAQIQQTIETGMCHVPLNSTSQSHVTDATDDRNRNAGHDRQPVCTQDPYDYLRPIYKTYGRQRHMKETYMKETYMKETYMKETYVIGATHDHAFPCPLK